MAVRETLLDLKKFRVGRNQSDILNYSTSLSYQNVDPIYKTDIHHLISNPDKVNVNSIKKNILNSLGLPSYLDVIQRKVIPDYIFNNPLFHRISYIHKHFVNLPLKKKQIHALSTDESKREKFIFLWEAFSSKIPKDIYGTLYYYDWSLIKSVEWLNVHKTPPIKELYGEELRIFLEESDDEYMEFEDSTDRLARAEFDIEEYSFIMDYGLINPLMLHNVPNNSHPNNNSAFGGNYMGNVYYNNNIGPIMSPYHLQQKQLFPQQSDNKTTLLAGQSHQPYLNSGNGTSVGLLNNPSINRIQINNSNVQVANKRKRGVNESTLQIALDSPNTDFANTVERFSNFTQQRNMQLKQTGVEPMKLKQYQQSAAGSSSSGGRNTPHIPNMPASTSLTIQQQPYFGNEKDGLVDFFNNSTKEELLTLKHCTFKKYETVVQQRPFKSYEELSAKCERFKFLGSELLQSAKKMLYIRRQVIKILLHCEQLSNNLQKAVENMMSRGTMVVQPSTTVAHSYSLKPYQIAGINWLNLLFKMNMNAILADEMGLGKTVQVLAFLQYLLESGVRGPILIVVPASTLENWTNEIAVWCPVSRITIYYGSQSERKDQRYFLIEEKGIEQLDIILTTYAMISSTTDDKNFFKRIHFTYVIFDEAHMLKNMTSLRYKFLMKLKSKYRILMTGTPIQNNLMELMSLLQFVLPDHIFEDKSEELKTVFCAYESPNSRNRDTLETTANSPISEIDNVENEDTSLAATSSNATSKRHTFTAGGIDKRARSSFEIERIEQAKRIVRPFVLRRTKAQVLDQLPSKVHDITMCKMTYEQNELYQKTVNDYKEELINSTSILPPMSIMMHLRKVANHPLMVRSLYTDQLLEQMSHAMINEPTHKHALPHLILSDMKVLTDFELYKLTKAFTSISSFKLPNETIVSSGKLVEIDKILPNVVQKGEKALIFSQFTLMLDILGEYLTIRGYKHLRIDGSTPVPERLTLIKNFSTDQECPFFLLSTKAGGLGINLICANHVVIHDIDINPYNDKQAEDRCHRVGQDKVVHVNRLISKGTIEEVILKCNEEKLKLEVSMTSNTGNNILNGLVLGGTDVFEGENPALPDDSSEDVVNLLKIAIGS